MALQNAEWDYKTEQIKVAPGIISKIPILHVLPYSVKNGPDFTSSSVSCPLTSGQKNRETFVISVLVKSSDDQSAIENNFVKFICEYS